MSSVYVSEPPTKGKVIVHTSHGPLDIELWPKEAPRAVRNFVQLCLEGYYDNTIFHRIIKSFLVQGGDPTGTGTGGESIYGSVFVDEFHSRLRFNHRGLVACANSGSPHSNGSQFFLSVDRCDWLDRKHTIFGKVTGDSMYNLLQLSEVETDENDRPLDLPPIIMSVEVLWNPFEDIVPRVAEIRSLKSEASDSDKKHLQKAAKNLSLLSFGEEAEEDEKEISTTKQKIKSSHDVLNDPRLLKDDTSSLAKKSQELQLSVREMLRLKKDSPKRDSKSDILDSADDNSDDEDEGGFDSRMRQQILRKRKELGDLPPIPKQRMNDDKESCNAAEYEEPVNRSNQQNSIINNEPIKEKLSIKRRGIGSELKAVRESNADVDLQLLGEAERGWYLLKQKKRRLHGREDKVLEKLEKFKKDFSQKQITSSGGDDNEEDISNWGTVPLKFASEHGKMSRTEEVDDYVVHDPLLEKGKEKFNRMQAREKRRGREWAGRSLT